MISQAKREVDLYLIPYTKINSEWIKNLNVKTKTIKFLKENIKMNIHIFLFGNHFLYTVTKAQATKRIKKEKLDFKKKIVLQRMLLQKTTYRTKEKICK